LTDDVTYKNFLLKKLSSPDEVKKASL